MGGQGGCLQSASGAAASHPQGPWLATSLPAPHTGRGAPNWRLLSAASQGRQWPLLYLAPPQFRIWSARNTNEGSTGIAIFGPEMKVSAAFATALLRWQAMAGQPRQSLPSTAALPEPSTSHAAQGHCGHSDSAMADETQRAADSDATDDASLCGDLTGDLKGGAAAAPSRHFIDLFLASPGLYDGLCSPPYPNSIRGLIRYQANCRGQFDVGCGL